MNAPRGFAPGEFRMNPEQAPETRDEPPAPLRRSDAFTAVFLPIGAIAGVILLFAFWTTDRLLLPGYSGPAPNRDVVLLGFKIGTADTVPSEVWASALIVVFVLVGAGFGLVIGKSLGRLARWGT